MAVRPIILLGDPLLWRPSSPVTPPVSSGERQDLARLLVDLKETLISFRRRYGTAKSISAPQIGVLRRVVYVHEPSPPRFLLNPVLDVGGVEKTEAWENCMSFPNLYVRTRRALSCSVQYLDEESRERSETAQEELSVILQHECDHLDGVLSLQRATDAHSFFLGGRGRHPARGATVTMG